MTAEVIFIIICILLVLFVVQFIVSYFAVKPINWQTIDKTKYCLIDIRDFNIAHHSPIHEAQNIPLSYLGRTSKERRICQKDIVFIADDRKAAGKAARIISKSMKNNRKNYFFVLQ